MLNSKNYQLNKYETIMYLESYSSMFRIRSLSKSFSYFERFPRRTKSQPRSEIILPTWPKRFVVVFLCGNPDRFLRYEITSETTIPKLLKDTVPKLRVWKSSTLLGMIFLSKLNIYNL